MSWVDCHHCGETFSTEAAYRAHRPGKGTCLSLATMLSSGWRFDRIGNLARGDGWGH